MIKIVQSYASILLMLILDEFLSNYTIIKKIISLCSQNSRIYFTSYVRQPHMSLFIYEIQIYNFKVAFSKSLCRF